MSIQNVTNFIMKETYNDTWFYPPLKLSLTNAGGSVPFIYKPGCADQYVGREGMVKTVRGDGSV